MADKSCVTCKAGRRVPGPDGRINLTQLECHLNPPSVSINLIPRQVPGISGVQIEVKVLTAFPTVKNEEECEQWAPLPETEH